MCSKMTKRLAALAAVVLLLFVAAPLTGVDFRQVNAASDFTVNDEGVLTAYNGVGGNIEIPSGVKEIFVSVFKDNTKITSVTFPNTLERIDSSAFRGCTGLKSIYLPNSVTAICDHVFCGCSNLTSVRLPLNLTSVSAGAFSYCPKLTTFDTSSCVKFKAQNGALYQNWTSVVAAPSASVVSIYSGASDIAEEAFAGNTNLQSVIVPGSIKSIGACAFKDCPYMYSINLSDSITSIGYKAFSGCKALTSVSVSSKVTTVPNNLFENCTGLTSVKLASGTTNIGNYAFTGCTSLKSISLPGTLTNLGTYAFQGCTALTSVTLPANVKVVPVGCFDGCTSLQSVNLPSTMTSIGGQAFAKTKSLTSITLPSSLTNIYSSAFAGSGLTSVKLPASVVLGDNGNNCFNAFQNCTALKGVTFMGKGGSGIASGMFKGCTSLTSIQIPYGLTFIGGSAFEGCTSLSSVSIPSTVQYINESAFAQCTALTKLTIPSGLKKVYRYAFRESGLTSAVLPDNVTIDEECVSLFSGCKNLKSVMLPRNLTVIPIQMFSDCASLTSISIPSTVTAIGDYAFLRSGLTSVSLPDATLGVGVFANCTALKSLVIPKADTTIDRSLLSGCTSLTSVTIPDTVIKINQSAFENCKSLTSVTLPPNIKLIATNTFKGCTSLSAITLPANVTTVGSQAFLDCSGLKTVTFKATGGVKVMMEAFKNCSAITTMTFPSGSTFDTSAFYGCTNWAGPVTIADSVTEIKDYTFYGCEKLKSLTIPSSVTKVGEYAFAGCKTLTSLSLGSHVTEMGIGACMNCTSLKTMLLPYAALIPAKAFQGCTSLTTATFNPNIKTVGASAFEGCTSMTSVTFPFNLTGIGPRAFYGCKNITKVYINQSAKITSLGASAFEGCSSLTDCPLPTGVTTLSSRAFANCVKLSSFTVPSSVVSIGQSAFTGCTDLSSLGLSGTALKTIGNYAFYNCASLKSASLPSSVTSIGYAAFYGCDKMTNVTIPKATTYVGSIAFSCPVYVVSGNTKYAAKEGILYNNDYTTLLSYPRTRTYINCDVASGTTAIGQYAFYNVKNLKIINLPDSVTKIDTGAFYQCANLTTVKFSSKVTTINPDAFYGCTQLNTVNYTGTQAQWNALMANGFNTTGNGPLINARQVVVNFGKTVSSVTVKTNPTKMTYTVGETFVPAGMTLNVTYTDGYKDVITKGFICTPSDKLTAEGQQKITVTYGGKTVSFYVAVNPVGKTVSSVAVKTKPTKQLYTVGETVDPKGMVLKITYSDKSTKEVTSGYTYTPSSKLTAEGQQKVVVTYGGKSDYFYVGVNLADKTVSSVAIKTKPTKQAYTVGETFDSKGMVLKITYSDKSTKDVTSGFFCYPVAKLTAEGQQKITVTYAGKSSSFYVAVNPVGKTISSVTVKTKPTKQLYTVGETIDPAGTILTVTYSDKSTKDVTSGFTYSPTSKLTAEGQQKVTVTYGGKTNSFYVGVNPAGKTVSSVAVKTKPTKITYTVGETFDSKGMVLKITYSDKSTKEVTSGFLCLPVTKLTAEGQQKITVTYAGKSTSFYVAVNPVGKTVSSVAVKTKPAKLAYTVGEFFNPKGMVLKITYSDNTTKEVTGGYTYTPTGALTTAGQQMITVTYAAKTASFYVTVNKVVASVAVKTKPTKQLYTVGETVDPKGMVLKITYSDKSTKEVTSGYTYTPSSKLTAEGQQKVVVTYGGKSDYFYVGVNPADKTVSSVAIKTKPAKQAYTVGETFDSKGMVLKITYSDKSTKDVTSGFFCYPVAKLTAEGQQKITVTYAGKSTSFYVAVNPVGKTISSVTVKTKPTKQLYTVGETIDPAGTILTVTYSDKSTKDVTSGFTYSPTSKLTAEGQQKVTVTYGGKTNSFYVGVNPAGKTVSSVAVKTKPTKITYTVGEIFDSKGMVLKITYSDKSTKEVTSGFLCLPVTKLTAEGQQKITVTYAGKTTSFNVTVNK